MSGFLIYIQEYQWLMNIWNFALNENQYYKCKFLVKPTQQCISELKQNKWVNKYGLQWIEISSQCE